MTQASTRLTRPIDPLKPSTPPGSDRLTGLRVFILGVETYVSRDTVRYLIEHKVNATVLGEDRTIELLQRDLELSRISAETAPIEVLNRSEMRLVTENLREQGGLPHLIVCCCPGPACPVPLVAPLMEPTLVLHLLAAGRGPQRWAAGLFATTLAALLDRRGLLNPAVPLPTVRLGRRLFKVWRRGEGGVRATRPLKVADHLVCVADNTVRAAGG